MRHLGPERVAEDLAKASTQMPLPPDSPQAGPGWWWLKSCGAGRGRFGAG